MTTAPDLETRVINCIRNNRKNDGGIYLGAVIGHLLGVEGAQVEAALTRLEDQGRIRRVGRERTMRRFFLVE